MMRKGKLIAISYFTGMTAALLIALLFSSLATAGGLAPALLTGSAGALFLGGTCPAGFIEEKGIPVN